MRIVVGDGLSQIVHALLECVHLALSNHREPLAVDERDVRDILATSYFPSHVATPSADLVVAPEQVVVLAEHDVDIPPVKLRVLVHAVSDADGDGGAIPPVIARCSHGDTPLPRFERAGCSLWLLY
ncbi:MAG: hypothetical protein WBB94_00180 [Candidatus Saccharimonadaceae bacterium]